MFSDWKFVPLNSLHLFHPVPQPLAPTSLFSISLSLVSFSFVHLYYFLDSTCKSDHMVFVFLCLTYFSQHNAIQIYPCCLKWKDFILFMANIPLCVCVCVCVSHLYQFFYLSGEAHSLKPATLARHHSNPLHELFYDWRS